MNILPSIVEAYSYANMYNNDDHGNELEKKLSGGLPVNTLNVDEIKGGGQEGPLANKVVPIGLALNRLQPNRFVEFLTEPDDIHRKIDVLSDSIFDEFINAVSVKSKSSKNSRRATTSRINTNAKIHKD